MSNTRLATSSIEMHRHLCIWVCSHVLGVPKLLANGNWIDAIFDGSTQSLYTLAQLLYPAHVLGAHCPRTVYET